MERLLIEHGAMEYRPTMADRMRRALGFRYHLGEDPEDIDNLEGWSATRTRMHFSIADRVRLLLSGRLLVVTTQHFNAPSPDIVKTRVDWQIGSVK
jgi:hypothetical protein